MANIGMPETVTASAPPGRTLRLLVSLVALCAAVALFLFGAFVNSQNVVVAWGHDVASSDSTTPATEPAVVARTEPDIVRDVTLGGLTRLPGGAIKQTYWTTPRSACPT